MNYIYTKNIIEGEAEVELGTEEAEALDKALDICMADEAHRITGRENGCTCSAFGDFVMETLTGILG